MVVKHQRCEKSGPGISIFRDKYRRTFDKKDFELFNGKLREFV